MVYNLQRGCQVDDSGSNGICRRSGLLSTEIDSQNYHSGAEKRRYSSESMREKTSEVFGETSNGE